MQIKGKRIDNNGIQATHSHGGDSNEGTEGSKEINSVSQPAVNAVLDERVEDAAESQGKTPPVVSPAKSKGDNDEGSLQKQPLERRKKNHVFLVVGIRCSAKIKNKQHLL